MVLTILGVVVNEWISLNSKATTNKTHFTIRYIYIYIYISTRAQAKEVNLVFNVLRNDAKNWPIERIQSSHCGANPRRILQLDWQ